MKQLSTREKLELMSRLTAEHQSLKARVKELAKSISLTTAEQVEIAELKKKKLLTKDRIHVLQRN